jgi:DNA gyrase subunit A
MIRIASEDVSVIGRNTSGVKIMRTDDDSTLVSIAKIKKEQKEEDTEEILDEESSEEVIEKALDEEEN